MTEERMKCTDCGKEVVDGIIISKCCNASAELAFVAGDYVVQCSKCGKFISYIADENDKQILDKIKIAMDSDCGFYIIYGGENKQGKICFTDCYKNICGAGVKKVANKIIDIAVKDDIIEEDCGQNCVNDEEEE